MGDGPTAMVHGAVLTGWIVQDLYGKNIPPGQHLYLGQVKQNIETSSRQPALRTAEKSGGSVELRRRMGTRPCEVGGASAGTIVGGTTTLPSG